MNRYLPIGIDIGADSIRALQLMGNARGTHLKAVACQPMDKRLTGSTEDADVLQSAIQALTNPRIFKGKRAILSLPGAYLFAFPVTIETSRQLPFEPALASACSKHLNFPIEEAVIDYLCVQKTANPSGYEQRVTVVAAHRKPINQLMTTFKKAGLKIEILDYGLCALVRLHNHIHTLTQAPSILVHMKKESTLMVVATQAEIIAHRHLDWGMGRLQQGMAKTLGIKNNNQQAQAMLFDYGVAYDALQTKKERLGPSQTRHTTEEIAAMRVASQILMPYMEEMVHELYQMIGYARSISPEFQFRELWLYEEGTGIKDLGPFLEKRLQIPTQRMNLSAKFALNDNKALGGANLNPYAIALGLTLREAI